MYFLPSRGVYGFLLPLLLLCILKSSTSSLPFSTNLQQQPTDMLIPTNVQYARQYSFSCTAVKIFNLCLLWHHMQSTNSVKRKIKNKYWHQCLYKRQTLRNYLSVLIILFTSTNSTKKGRITCWIEQLGQSFNVIPFTFQIIVNTDVVAILLFSTTSSLFNVNDDKWNKPWQFFLSQIVFVLWQHVLNSGERVRKLTVI